MQKNIIKEDPSNDLRIDDFVKEMKNGCWSEDNEIVTDGIHRGIAYLKCVKIGVTDDRLPKILVKSN
jgi:hypothetical protein